MSEYAGRELTPEQQAYLTAAQAGQAAAEASARGGDAGAQQAQMTDRGPLLPAEAQADEMMAALKKQLEEMGAQIAVLQKQQQEASAVSGGPLPVRYARAVRDHLAALAVAHPDLGRAVTAPDGTVTSVDGHFAGVVADADELVAAAEEHARTGQALDRVRTAADRIERFADRGHRRAGKHVEYGTVLHHLDEAVDHSRRLAS